MNVGVPKESFPGETRVATVPAVAATLIKAGLNVRVERGAGALAGIRDADYEEKGVEIVDRDTAYQSDVILAVRHGGANLERGAADVARVKNGQLLIAFLDPLNEPKIAREVAYRRCTAFAMELIPRITRAQSMDALSSMATVAGYKAVLLAANELPRMFPMMMTAAGTITPARVFVMGAGVAGLQAIATAKRLGAVVHAYDVRPAVKEQVASLGAKFVEVDLETGDAEDKGGYAKEQGEEFLRRQRELMMEVVGESDVVITTAAIPGRKAPILVTQAMVEAMRAGSVIVDLAAERGGNCELTQLDEVVVHNDVKILGPENITGMVPFHASQMYAKNVATLLLHLYKDGELVIDDQDEVVSGTMLCQNGELVHPRIRELLGEKPIEREPPSEEPEESEEPAQASEQAS